MMTKSLNPCPFCGHEAVVSDDEAEYLEWLREVSSGLDHILN